MDEVISTVQMSISGTRCRIIIPVPLLFLGRLNFQKSLYICAHTILKENLSPWNISTGRPKVAKPIS